VDRAAVFRVFEPEDELAEPAFFLLAMLNLPPGVTVDSTGVRAGPQSAAGGRKGARL
jgi:hypothetical protein